MKVLVLGGAGYIGSHTVRQLLALGCNVVVLDDLSQGHLEAADGVEFVRGSILNTALLAQVFAKHAFDAVLHFAALTSVSESMERPDLYYRNNLGGTLNVLDAMIVADVRKLVFSSTAAIFGQPLFDKIAEDHPKNPLNPYGRSKLMVEQVLADYATSFGLRSVSLRYFNAAGAHLSGGIGEAHHPETHLIPNVLLTALGRRDNLQIFGDDYDTRDGTCVRDYIHVDDIAAAHIGALDFMQRSEGAHQFNLGNGDGFTIKEVVAAAEEVVGKSNKISTRLKARRSGDVSALVADSTKARNLLGWAPNRSSLEEILQSAWDWHKNPRF